MPALWCVVGALYAAANATLASGPFELSPIGIRFALLHASSWFVYTLRREGRALFRYERMRVGGLLICALLSLVPRLVYDSDEHWVHHVPVLGITYFDAHSTRLGNVMLAGVLGRAEAAGLLALMLTGVNDTLVDSALVPTPYLLDLGSWRWSCSAALGEMSAVVAHEVRNPVAVIFNAAAALRKNPQEREKLLAIVEEEAGRLKRMVSDLLDFARPASLHLVEEPLAPIIESALLVAILEAWSDDEALRLDERADDRRAELRAPPHRPLVEVPIVARGVPEAVEADLVRSPWEERRRFCSGSR